MNYTEVVYDYIRTLGDPGDEVMTSIRPYLEREFNMTYAQAARARATAMRELADAGRVVRLNVRGRYVKILS